MEPVGTAEEILAQRNQAKIDRGLQEQKFFLRGVAEATHEEIYQDLNGLYDAYERGDYIELCRTTPNS